jgi:hypothetical protein
MQGSKIAGKARPSAEFSGLRPAASPAALFRESASKAKFAKSKFRLGRSR